MGSIHEDDPFLWDTETLSKEICSQNTPWIKNPAALAAKLVDQDIDGHTLLTYELLFSRAELMECLNMTTARSKAGLAETILNFQARSKSFRPWKKNFSKNQSMLLSDDEQHDLKAELSTIPPLKRHLDPAPTPNTHSISAQHEPQGIAEAPLENDQITQAFDDTLLETDGDYPMQLNGDADFATSVDFANGLPSINPQDSPNTPTNARVGKEKSCQRRRLGVKLPLEYSPPLEYSYLGSKGLCRQTILSSTIDAPDHPCMNLGRGGFAVLSPNHAKPPGQRLVVNRILQKQFLKNSRKEATMKRGFIPLQSPAPSNKSASVIDFDDLPDSWDEETQREIDEEKAEVAARKRKLARYLSRERVEAILKDEIAAMEAKWRETNQPRVRHEIYKKWMDAKRNGRMKSLILATLKSAQSYDKHFKKLYTEILLLNWEKESDVRFQAVSLEQTLRNRLEETRHVELFERHDPPPKPLGVLKPKSSAKKAPLDYSDEEILTSSDEEEFVIIDNDPDMTMTDLDVTMTDEDFFKSAPEPPLQRHDREASHPLSEIDASMVIDLTQVESLVEPQVRKATIECIDLTISPIKKKLDEAPPLVKDEPIDLIGEVPPMDQLGSLEKIGETPIKHWTKAKDRWRLVLCLLWKFIQARREPILQLMQENAAEDAWRLSIGSYQVNPFTKESEIGEDPAKTTAFDLTKLFLSCSQCRQYTDDRVVALNKKDKNRLSRAKAFFPAFHAFIREWAPEYPQSSQIYRTDAFDDEIGLDDLDEHSANVIESPSKPRKRVVKEIVQDKAGLKLREQGKKRAEEYEARATKNLNLATLSTTMTEREARLIINESKQDDQPFIYISSTIGDRIKDHQIKGVRFLWNQIILDSDLRQGCLLAHTMGLGKTMQVITLLVAIAEAANSDDESIKAQIPIDLRRSQSLIICPAGLVNNWLDEIKAWSPEDLLGNVFMVESAQAKREQISTIEDWGQYGGVLVIGHEMFKRMRSVNDNIKQILTNKANMVICDEAHMMKNPDSQLHQVLQDFHTKRRIALTGSPLSNSVNEYYSMINWVAPGYLGPKKEFTDIYTDPIEKGLHSESERSDKRKALKRLEALKMTVTPKVQRATVQAVKHELPPKYEFVIFVKPTPLQERLYGIYLNEMVATSSKTTVFNLVQKLGIICNHPRCFRQQMLNQKAALAITTPKAAPQPISGTGVEEAGDESEGPDRPTKFSLNMISTVLKETNGKDIANPELSQKVALLLVVLDQSRAVGDKVIVFSESIHTLNYLEELFKQQRRAVQRLDGSTPVSKRQGMVKAFNAGKAGESEVYLISTRAGGVGLNIQGANRVVIFDFKWNPVNEQQAVGRSYRFGQEKTVYVYRFVIAGSFEEVLQNRSVFKTQLASSVIDKKNPIAWGKRNGDLFKPLWTKPATDLSPFLGRDKILDKLIEQSRTSGAIRQILSTDTFEEEDPTNELTAEEKRDAQELHDMERLKQADPGKYRKLWEEKQRIEQIRAMAATAPRSLGAQIPSTYSSPYSAQPQSNQQASVIPGISFHPAPSANTPSLSQAQSAPIVPTTSRAHFPSSAPLPITGANTYIRNPAAFTNPSENTNAIIPIRSSSTPEQGPESRPRPPDPSSASMLALTPRNFHAINTPSQTTSLFSQPRTQDKMDFEKVLASLISGQLGYTGNGTELAEKITVGVADALKEQAMGFVPDNLRWRLLLNLVREHHRFVLAIMWGNCSPVYLATAPDKEIHNRVSLMNSQPQDDFDAQLRRSASAPDPSNLHSNINRPWAQSARANEDAEAMRQTVHNRTERGFRLPPWANNALSKSNSQTQ